MIQRLFPAKGLKVEPRSLENPRTSLANPDEWLWEAFGASRTSAGVAINEKTALTIGAVYACVRIIAETVASLPLLTYQRLPRGKERAPEHPLYDLLHDRPNPEMSAMTFRETLQAHVLVYGNGYAEIETNKAGTVIALWPLLPDRTYPERRNGQKLYWTVVDGTRQALSEERVFHLPGLGFDGLTGYSPIQMAKRSLGLTAATEEFGAAFFGRGAQLGVVLEHPGKLSKEAQTRLRESFETMQSGLTNAHRAFIAEEGMKVAQSSIPPDHAQFLETRKFQVTDVARLYRVPPHMLADLESGASYASVEQMSLDFVTYTLRPWLVRWEQAINHDLFGARERSSVFAEHLVDGLLRGDLASRYNAYQVARQNGWLSANDIRELENMNAIAGGDVYLVNGNMITADQAAKPKPEPAPAPATPPPTDPNANRAGWVGLLRDVGERMVKRELPQLRKAAKQGDAGWSQAVEAVYREQLDVFTKALTPVFDAIVSFGPAEARSLAGAARALAHDLATEELTAARGALDRAGLKGADTLLATWEQGRAGAFAERGADFITRLLHPTLEKVA